MCVLASSSLWRRTGIILALPWREIGRGVWSGSRGTGCLLNTGLVSGSFMSFENRPVRLNVLALSLDKHISTADKLLLPDGWCWPLSKQSLFINLFIHFTKPYSVSPMQDRRRKTVSGRKMEKSPGTQCVNNISLRPSEGGILFYRITNTINSM